MRHVSGFRTSWASLACSSCTQNTVINWSVADSHATFGCWLNGHGGKAQLFSRRLGSAWPGFRFQPNPEMGRVVNKNKITIQMAFEKCLFHLSWKTWIGWQPPLHIQKLKNNNRIKIYKYKIKNQHIEPGCGLHPENEQTIEILEKKSKEIIIFPPSLLSGSYSWKNFPSFGK